MSTSDEEMEKRLKMIIRQFSGEVKKGDGEMVPEVAIKGHSGTIHCYAPSKKRIVRISRGTKAFVLSIDSKNEKSLIYTFDGKIVEIDCSELIETGFD
tara:strand:+ start:1080 stop:1373 length:294 start_codon:yes stop_codon:yes gene_type:complete